MTLTVKKTVKKTNDIFFQLSEKTTGGLVC